MSSPTTPRTWTYTAGPFRAFDHSFAIGCSDEALGAHLEHLWAGCRADVDPRTIYGLDVVGSPHDANPAYRLNVNGLLEWETTDPSVALRDLVRRINAGVTAEPGELIVMHAAGAVLDGAGVLFPAPSESGKSTLVAALVRAGWQYLSDEAIGIHPETHELHPYAKPISLDPGSWPLLSELEPPLAVRLGHLNAVQWQVAALAIRTGSFAGPTALAFIVRPGFGGRNALSEPLARAAGLRELSDCCSSLRSTPQRALDVLASVIGLTPFWSCTYDDVEGAVAIVRSALKIAVGKDAPSSAR